ncbi:hypothetical protein SMACR_04182 [Sordaria macrospora]|uniref:Myb-like domain-containing protein n=1 Tax=Sordaria macrospora TaxID=5147 RepID=A0A8S8ZIE8_SORMA|nr:hypothetical protein SMACR_04182 [Sordaria macrospora]WPJ64477.1 hypothetical protein SMAC4_04182 [Sordaria macrospora]
MPPKAAAAAAFFEGAASGPVINGQPLTLKELQAVCAILENLTTRIDANWELVAKSLGMQNAKSAKEAWRVLRKKCNLNPDGLSDGAAGAGAVLATVSSAKKAVVSAAAAGTDGSDAGVGVTPVKRGRGRPPKKTMMLTPSTTVNEGGDAISTPGTAMANLSFGDMTPETPSKIGSGIKRSAEEADPDAILFDETPAKKKPAPSKHLTVKQKAELAANKAEMAAAQTAEEVAAASALAAAAIDEPVNDPATPGLEPASSPVDGANGHDGDSILVAMDGSSHVEQAIGDILASDATEAADLVGGIDPGEV